jgi:hypothetical protein
MFRQCTVWLPANPPSDTSPQNTSIAQITWWFYTDHYHPLVNWNILYSIAGGL